MSATEVFGSRRRFVKSAAVGAAMAVVGRPGEASAAKREAKYVESHRVDVHAHYLAPVYLEAFKAAGITTVGGLPTPAWSPALARTFMKQHAIQLQMLSVSDPGVDFLQPAAAAQLARDCNDYVAGVVKADPKHFGAFAVLSLQDTAVAVTEAKRALDELKLDGIGLLSSAAGAYLGDARFASLLSELNARGAWVMVHPHAVAADQKPSYSIPDFIAEYPFDTTRTIISLLFNGAFAKYPRIRWQFAHGGGTVPMLRARLTVLAANAKAFGSYLGLPAGASVLNEHSAIKALGKSYYDTALIADPPSLEAVGAMAGAGQLLFGSDWPFAARLYDPKVSDPQPALSSVFDATERHDVERRNARRQFARAAASTPKR